MCAEGVQMPQMAFSGVPTLMPMMLQPAYAIPVVMVGVPMAPSPQCSPAPSPAGPHAVGLPPAAQAPEVLPASPLAPLGLERTESDASGSFGSSGSWSSLGSQMEAPVLGRVWQLSQRQKGCRKVQDAIDQSSSNELRRRIALELSGHVVAASVSPNANHVVQRLIATLLPRDCQFLVDEILQGGSQTVLDVARHQYGCRILQRLLEHCHQEQMEGIANALVTEALSLARHAYGNFVMQQLMQFGSASHQRYLCQVFQANVHDLLMHPAASPVIAKALTYAPEEDKANLARAAVSPRLADAAITRYGYETVQQMLQVLTGEGFDAAICALRPRLAALWAARYGRVVVKSVPELHQLCSGMTRSEAMARA